MYLYAREIERENEILCVRGNVRDRKRRIKDSEKEVKEDTGRKRMEDETLESHFAETPCIAIYTMYNICYVQRKPPAA